MIVVIADDISGAAELAGVAQAWGLSAELQTRFDSRTNAAVLAITTETRSLSGDEAARRVREVATLVSQAQPE
jgi:D-threonate/D-erythronate kinase